MTTRIYGLLAGAALLAVAAGVAPTALPARAAALQQDAEARLLPLGKEAPDFSLPQLGGGEISLANLLKVSKAVLVGFWALEPKEGGADLAKLQKLNDDLGDKGLSVVAVNPRDEADEIQAFVNEHKLSLPIGVDGKATNRAVTNVYKARTLPTYYVLDSDGKVVWRSIGLKEAPLKEALHRAGVK